MLARGYLATSGKLREMGRWMGISGQCPEAVQLPGMALQGRLLFLTSGLTWAGLLPTQGPSLWPLSRCPIADDHLTQQTPEHQVSISGEATDCSQRQPHLEEAAWDLLPSQDPDAFGRNVDSTRPRATWAQRVAGASGQWLPLALSSSPGTKALEVLVPQLPLLAKLRSSPKGAASSRRELQAVSGREL